jgi:hypothetical protein
LSYENGAPIFTCEKCGDRELTWKKFYDEYLQLFRDKSNWGVKKHQVSCIIGFFCHMYKEFYGTDYVFVPQNPNPYGCKEVKDSLKLLATFSGNAHDVRKYIFWVFKKIIKQSTNLTAFAYINSPSIIRKYKLYAEKKNRLTRSSKLPKQFLDWCKQNAPELFDKYELETMNDLGALSSYLKEYDDGTDQFVDERGVVSEARKYKLIKENSYQLNLG